MKNMNNKQKTQTICVIILQGLFLLNMAGAQIPEENEDLLESRNAIPDTNGITAAIKDTRPI